MVGLDIGKIIQSNSPTCAPPAHTKEKKIKTAQIKNKENSSRVWVAGCFQSEIVENTRKYLDREWKTQREFVLVSSASTYKMTTRKLNTVEDLSGK